MLLIFFRLIQKVGEKKALEMLCCSKIYNATECLQLGLADKMVSCENKEAEALAYVRKFTVNHSSIIRSYKQLTHNYTEKLFEDSLKYERNEFYPKWGSELNSKALQKNIRYRECKVVEGEET